MVGLSPKLKMPKKILKNYATRTKELCCAKNRSKKHQIFEKCNNFKNRQPCKNYSPCKDYSLCKLVGLGQKLKIAKTCEKLFHKNIRVVLCKKSLEKNTKYSRNATFLKICHLAKAISHAKAIAFAKGSAWVKN